MYYNQHPYPYQANPYYVNAHYVPYYPTHQQLGLPPHYYPQHNYNQSNAHIVRQYPAVDPTVFNESAVAFQKLLKEASIVLNKLADSKDFAGEVMSAAQESNMQKVEELIESTGVHSKVDVSYNPDGIRLEMKNKVEDTDCCHLTMALKW